MKSFRRLFIGIWSVVFLLFVPAQASASTIWAAVFGDPSSVPDEAFAYLDAHAACVANVPIPPNTECNINYRNVRSFNGPQGQGGCVIDSTCNCSQCGTSQFPNGGQTMTSPTGWSTAPRTLAPCPEGQYQYLGLCRTDPSKANGDCPDCRNLQWSNPTDIGTGNKRQTETVYRAGSGGLELVLSYNSQPGSGYVFSGPFGRGWSSAYFVRLRDSAQGIVAVERPDGKELEFTQPASGNLFLADADITHRLERVPNGSQVLSWLVTSPENGRVEEHDGAWSLLRGYAGTLVRIRDRALTERFTMTYSTLSTPSSIAPRPNLLIAVADKFGRQLGFTYDSKNRVVTMTDAGGGAYQFEYDGPSGPANANNLTRITFPDGKTRVYFYGESAHINGGATCSTPSPILPNALTGLQDENGVRFATWTWGCDGRVTGSQHAGGVENYTFTYGAGTRTVVNPLGASREIGVQRTLGIVYATGITQPAASGSGTVANSFTRDAQGNLSSKTDYNGNRTDYTYDLARNLETSRTEGLTSSGATTAQTRTISTQWHSTFRLPTGIAEPLRITTFVYDPDGTQCGARGAMCSKSIQTTTDTDGSQGFSATSSGSPRTWTYTYNANSSVLSVNGPRTDAADTTSYTYYADNDADAGKRGNVATITNALGHTTNITAYNAHGQPFTIVDPNGLTTTLSYDARQRLKTRTVGGETTSYDYDSAGQLTQITLPDGSFLSYSYDNARRLTGMQDSLGNRIAYTVDAMGNRTQEQVFDPANQLAQTRSRVYNSLNRLFRELGAQSQTTEYAYDDQGNVLTVKDPLNRVTTNQYDALNRLKQVTSPTPISAVTQYGYNGLDALVQVTDPRSLVTGYSVDGLGNLNVQTSPDTGSTTNTYDAAGNLLTQTDAKSQLTTYAYDALNRVTLITFHDGSTQTYAYDQGVNGLGRLSSITETNAASQTTSVISYVYDVHGRVTTETRSVGGTQYVLAYRYDSAGRLDRLTYPSGRTVNYAFDGLGRLATITTAKATEQPHTVVSAVAYHPFGGVKGFTLGNGQAYSRGIDQDGRIASYTLGAQSFALGYDSASRISFISEVANPSNTNNYGYDELDRLTSASLPTTPYAYSYDGVGNRLSRTAGTSSHVYAYSSTSNRIASITPSSGPVRNFTFDLNGSTTDDGVSTYAYDVRGRMVQAANIAGTTSYQVNALGQRIRKTNSAGDTVFHYDSGGRLIAETAPSGTVKREYIYLGDIPVGVAQ
jgi:YD repeat-containing protein